MCLEHEYRNKNYPTFLCETMCYKCHLARILIIIFLPTEWWDSPTHGSAIRQCRCCRSPAWSPRPWRSQQGECMSQHRTFFLFFFKWHWTHANMDEFILSKLSIHLFLDLNLDQTFIIYKGRSAMKQVCIWKPFQSEWREQLNST